VARRSLVAARACALAAFTPSSATPCRSRSGT
jgi:hypothetical protein